LVFGTTQEIQALATRGRLIDVRTAAEFEAFHIPGAVNVPLDVFSLHLPRLAALGGPLALTCHSGKRAEQARVLLASCGKSDLVLVEGGTEGWRARGDAVVEGTKAISLERQVRITAGALVALGAALALGVATVYAAIPLVIGTGLVVAGITDTCLMGSVLARMPWNRRTARDAGTTLGQLEAACSSSA
jgi:rhodanese-related sulfurtransferase